MILAIWKYVSLGGWAMIPILITMGIGFFLFFLRYSQLRTETKQIKRVNRWLSLIESKNFEELNQEINQSSGAIGRMLKSGFENKYLPKTKLENSMKQRFYSEYEGIHRHLGTLQMLANVLPMLGLVGTVSGIIVVFKVVGQVGGGDPQAMGAGISEALVATLSGLVGAIPILIGHHLLSDKADHVIIELKRIASAFINHAEG